MKQAVPSPLTASRSGEGLRWSFSEYNHHTYVCTVLYILHVHCEYRMSRHPSHRHRHRHQKPH